MAVTQCGACSDILLKTGPERMENDGLNSLRYEMKTFEKRPLYTRILVHIDEHAVLVGYIFLRTPIRTQRIVFTDVVFDLNAVRPILTRNSTVWNATTL